jgi:hypothetical protein
MDTPAFKGLYYYLSFGETSSRERGNFGREMTGKFCRQIASSTPFEGIFYMPQICDMGPTALLPVRRKDFFALKNPTASASAGFEPANLGTRGQHANPQTTEGAYSLVKFCV